VHLKSNLSALRLDADFMYLAKGQPQVRPHRLPRTPAQTRLGGLSATRRTTPNPPRRESTPDRLRNELVVRCPIRVTRSTNKVAEEVGNTQVVEHGCKDLDLSIPLIQSVRVVAASVAEASN
jgi:hypothetical protein